MKFYLISDNVDTQVGMRLAGIEGTVVHEKEEVVSTLGRVCDDPQIGIILMTKKLIDLCPDMIYDLKLNRKSPLIVEIPDRHGEGQVSDSILQYVREAIGVKI